MVGLLKPTSQEAEIQSAGNQASDVARFNPSTPPRLTSTCLDLMAQAPHITAPPFNVECCPLADVYCGRLIDLTHDLSRCTHNEAIIWNYFAFGNQRVSANQTVTANPCSVEDGRAHPDQRA